MAVDNPNYFSNYDYARVKHSIFWSEDVIDWIVTADWVWDFEIWKKNYLSVDYKTQYIEVIEYWEADRMCILFNGSRLFGWHMHNVYVIRY
jgi:hypothetical protein